MTASNSTALTNPISVWQVEVLVKHYGVTMAASKQEAIANCNRDGWHGKVETISYRVASSGRMAHSFESDAVREKMAWLSDLDRLERLSQELRSW